jgi:ABC-type Fe3+/spermidine/putrescine transport system ATPase subunit
MDGLVLTEVSKRYGSLAVVDRLSLALRPGEFVSLLGPSGCGKTTTLRMIAGFVQPTAGRIAAGGRLLSSEAGALPPERRGMSMIFQSYALWPNMTVEQNVAFGLAMRKVGRSERRRRVGEILDAVRLGHLAGRYPNELSGGQQQRVALARALVVKPDILLLDEPLSNLDAALRESMRREIRRLHDAFGTTSVYVTHDQGEAMATSDRIAIMNKGRIEQIADPRTLHARPATRHVAAFLGNRNVLEGVRRDGTVEFPGFSIPAARLGDGTPPAGTAFSVHARALSLSPDRPGGDAVAVEGRLTERVFLGEAWDYGFQAEGADLRLRVTAPAGQALEIGERVFVTMAPAAFVSLRDDG